MNKLDLHCLLCTGEKHHVTTRAIQSCPIPHFLGRQSHSFGSTGFLLTADLCSLNLSSRSSERCKHILSAAVAMRGLMRGNERNTQLNSARITNQSQRNKLPTNAQNGICGVFWYAEKMLSLSDECVMRGVREAFLPAHLHFLRSLTDVQSRLELQNQTPAMETRLCCVCVLALVILKGKLCAKVAGRILFSCTFLLRCGT